MDYKVIWSPRGIASLREQIQYITRHNPIAARRMGEVILSKALLLGQFPHMGKVFEKLGREDVREILVRPYRLFHHVQDAHRSVTIITVWHGARQEPDDLVP